MTITKRTMMYVQGNVYQAQMIARDNKDYDKMEENERYVYNAMESLQTMITFKTTRSKMGMRDAQQIIGALSFGQEIAWQSQIEDYKIISKCLEYAKDKLNEELNKQKNLEKNRQMRYDEKKEVSK